MFQRPGDFDIDPIFRIPERTENYASLNPPTASCCVKPEAVLAFDLQGNLLKHWNQADSVAGHLILADNAGNIWIGSDTMRKYDKDGKVLATMPRVSAPNPKAGDFPADTPMIVGRVEGGYFDEPTARSTSPTATSVAACSSSTWTRWRSSAAGRLRQAAEGHSRRGPAPKYDPKAPPAKDFIGHLTVAVSRDGFVYAADRQADRIQVDQKDGKFVREFTVAPETLDGGSTGGMAFSPDQRFIYVSDIMNNGSGS